jgi:hypothetical protein
VLDHRTQRTQAEIEATKTLVCTTKRGFVAKIAEVAADFLGGLETTWHEFRTQLADVGVRRAREFSEYSTTEARTDRGSSQRAGSDAGVEQIHKFDRLTSRAVFRHQFETMAKQRLDISTGATYEEATAVVENCFGDDPWRKHSILS